MQTLFTPLAIGPWIWLGFINSAKNIRDFFQVVVYVEGVMKKMRYSTNISFYLGNDTRHSRNYYGRRIGNRIPKLSNGRPTSFSDLE